MADIFDYISWRGDLTFEQDGFNELDALVLSRLSYLPFDGAVSSCLFDEITLEQAAMRVFATDDYEKNLLWKGDADLLKATAESKRFGKILVSGYVNEVESNVSMQFSAITFEFLKKNYLFHTEERTFLLSAGRRTSICSSHFRCRHRKRLLIILKRQSVCSTENSFWAVTQRAETLRFMPVLLPMKIQEITLIIFTILTDRGFLLTKSGTADFMKSTTESTPLFRSRAFSA